MRLILALAAAVAVTALTAGGASADPKVRCDVTPFTFSDAIVIDVDFGPPKARVETEATGSTTFDCGGLGVLGVDVWEHAYYVVHDSGRIGGREEIVIDFTSAGVRVSLEGSIRGRRIGGDVVDVILFATNPGGARLGLEQTGMLDLDAETLDLDVEQGAWTSPIWYEP